MSRQLPLFGVKLPPEFLRRKLASARFVNPGPLPVSAEIDAASTESA